MRSVSINIPFNGVSLLKKRSVFNDLTILKPHEDFLVTSSWLFVGLEQVQTNDPGFMKKYRILWDAKHARGLRNFTYHYKKGV